MPKGKHNNHPDSDIMEIREKYASGLMDMPGLAERFQFPTSRISKIIRGETRAGAGGPIIGRKGRVGEKCRVVEGKIVHFDDGQGELWG